MRLRQVHSGAVLTLSAIFGLALSFSLVLLRSQSVARILGDEHFSDATDWYNSYVVATSIRSAFAFLFFGSLLTLGIIIACKVTLPRIVRTLFLGVSGLAFILVWSWEFRGYTSLPFTNVSVPFITFFHSICPLCLGILAAVTTAFMALVVDDIRSDKPALPPSFRVVFRIAQAISIYAFLIILPLFLSRNWQYLMFTEFPYQEDALKALDFIIVGAIIIWVGAVNFWAARETHDYFKKSGYRSFFTTMKKQILNYSSR